MAGEEVDELPNRLNIGHLNAKSSKQLAFIANQLGESNPRHTINLMVESLFKAMKKEVKGDAN